MKQFKYLFILLLMNNSITAQDDQPSQPAPQSNDNAVAAAPTPKPTPLGLSIRGGVICEAGKPCDAPVLQPQASKSPETETSNQQPSLSDSAAQPDSGTQPVS